MNQCYRRVLDWASEYLEVAIIIRPRSNRHLYGVGEVR
jgi:hypothetical protein